MDLLLKNGYVVDSASGFEGRADILIRDNLIRDVSENISAPDAQVIDCEGLTVIPGICDMHGAFPRSRSDPQGGYHHRRKRSGGRRSYRSCLHAEYESHYRQCGNGALHHREGEERQDARLSRGQHYQGAWRS